MSFFVEGKSVHLLKSYTIDKQSNKNKGSGNGDSMKIIAFRITLVYLLIGSLWILFSDYFLTIFIKDAGTLTRFQTYKGWFYVFITSIILFFLVQRFFISIKKSQDRVQYMLLHDVLTKLPNTYYFKKELEKRLKKAKNDDEKIAVFGIYIDRMHQVRSVLGFEFGNHLLKEVALRLRKNLKEELFLSFSGGVEFSAISPNYKDCDSLKKEAKEILELIEIPVNINGYICHPTANIGIATFPDDGQDMDTLIKYTSQAMYQANKNGQSFQFYSSNKQSNDDFLRVTDDLHQALNHGEFSLHYQPQMNMKTGDIFGVEALLRWKHPAKGMIPPSDFIPILEENGLIVPIGEWVLKTALKQTKEWHEKGFFNVSVSVNLSIRQLFQEDIVEKIKQIIRETEIDPRYLYLEITESMAMNEKHFIRLIDELKKLGIQISIDDFGTGFSSLNYLNQLAIDKLKIDKSFINDLPNSQNNKIIVSTIIAMAHQLGLKVTGEGIEEQDQFNFLSQQNCDEIQGYLCSAPLPPEKLEALFFEIEEKSREMLKQVQNVKGAVI